MGILVAQEDTDLRQIDALILTALPSELDAVLEAGGGIIHWQCLRDPNGLSYYVSTQKLLRVAAACSPSMGETAAADRARTLVDHLKPKMLAMCGICAGKRNSVSLGDLIVADRLFSYDHGSIKTIKNSVTGADLQILLCDIETYNVSKLWTMEVPHFKEKWQPGKDLPQTENEMVSDLLDKLKNGTGYRAENGDESKRLCMLEEAKQIEIDVNKEGFVLTQSGHQALVRHRALKPDKAKMRVKVGPVATGKAVRKDGLVFEQVETHSRKVLGVEMEGAAIGWVAHISDIPFFFVKGVVDYADEDKDDSFHEFCCAASAGFLLDFLAQFPPDWLRQTRACRTAANIRPIQQSASTEQPQTAVGQVDITLEDGSELNFDWGKFREGAYIDCGDLMLVHRFEVSATVNQKFDITIYLMPHKSARWDSVQEVEYFLGKFWANRVFRGQGPAYSINTSAYDPFLCLCKITFKDGTKSLQSRYIDFEMERGIRSEAPSPPLSSTAEPSPLE